MSGKLNILTSQSIEAAAQKNGRIRHGFFARQGGKSKGLYQGLNVGIGSDDHTPTVHENRAMAASALGVAAPLLATPYQVHSPSVAIVPEDWAPGDWDADNRPKADAVASKNSGLAIGIVTADCGPVLFADPEAGVIGAAHAGWKGAIGGVLETTIDAMESLGATRANIHATLGPTISQANYEVGPEFVEQFVSQSADHAEYFAEATRPGHKMFDLVGFIVDRLNRAGVQGNALNVCTYADPKSFYSYRRSTHQSEPDYGRQLSAISLLAE